MSRDHCCTLCGRRCRYARDVCSTCRVGVGLVGVGKASCAKRLRTIPRGVRRAWSDEFVAQGHARYVRDLTARDDLTVARESEYQRRLRTTRRTLRAAAAS